MRVLVLHNRYQQHGGEDVVVESERHLLAQRGHSVFVLEMDNSTINGTRDAALVGIRAIYSRASAELLKIKLETFRPDVVHAHNLFPQFSPSVYFACEDFGVPVVQTLHNYRLVCPNALLFRDGKICEKCVGKTLAWPGIAHACYRDQRLATSAVAAVLATHHALGTWNEKIHTYVAPSRFARNKFVDAGFPADKLVLKPNFLDPDPGPGNGSGDYALFIGRLSDEKGLRTLLEAWNRLPHGPVLKVIGRGPLESEAQRIASPLVQFLGSMDPESLFMMLGEAQFLVVPSECYEVCPRVVIEAFAKGTPIIASDMGALAELVDDGRTGIHFRAADPQHLAEQVMWAANHRDEIRAMRKQARAEYLAKYTGAENYRQLMEIYRRTLN